jgi:hypothetical protein
MAARAGALAQKRADAWLLAEATLVGQTYPTPGTRRHAIDKLAQDMLISGLLAEETDNSRRRFHRLETNLRPTAAQRFVEATSVDATGALLPAVQQRLTRELAAASRAEERAQIADRLGAFERQRVVLARGSRALATRQQSRAKNSRAPKMPVRRTTRKPAPKMWVTPTGRVTTMAAHRKRSAASRSAARTGGIIGRPRANMPRRGGAFLGSPASMIREAAAGALKSALSKYVKPAARKAVKAGSRWAKGAGHRAVNSLSKSGEAALLNMIGSGLNLPGLPRRRVGGAMARRISYVPAASFRPSASRALYGSGIRLATGRRRPAGRR